MGSVEEEKEEFGLVIYRRRRALSVQPSQRTVRSWIVHDDDDDDDDELINKKVFSIDPDVLDCPICLHPFVTTAILHALRAAPSSRQNVPFAAPLLVSTVVEVLRNLFTQSLGYPANMPSLVAKTQCLTLTRVSMNKRAHAPLATALTRHALLPLLTNISTFTFTSIPIPPPALPATPPSLLLFEAVVEILDISNMIIEIKTRAQFLSPNVVYGVYLVFKFCDSRNCSSKPMYVNLKYRKGHESLHACFATWRDEQWMMIELHRFSNQNEHVVFEFLLESFSTYHCGDAEIFLEGIEFRAIDRVS
ncbi:kinase-like domain, phloem protein 2-like protein [Tanacetum coccineum]